jgi:hypothetical protein
MKIIDAIKDTDFQFNVFSKRWGCTVSYTLRITDDGWEVSHNEKTCRCDKCADPCLYGKLDQDFVNYPHDLKFAMAEIYEKAFDEMPDPSEIQVMLDQVAEWVKQVDAVPEPEFRHSGKGGKRAFLYHAC